MNLRKVSLRHHGLFFALLCTVSLTACVGATRLPVRSRGPTGERVPAGGLDMSFLEGGSAHHDDVSSKLASIDTGYRDPHLFWGRWADSKWGYWWIVVSPGPTSGTAAAGDAKRIWHVKNLLVTFDDNGVIQKREVIDKDSVLWRELHAYVAQRPAVDFSEPRSLALDTGSRSVLLHPDYLEVMRKKKGPVRIAPSSIVRFEHVSAKNKRESAGVTCHSLHFSEKTRIGRDLHLCGDAEMVVTLFEYLQQTAPKSMRWE